MLYPVLEFAAIHAFGIETHHLARCDMEEHVVRSVAQDMVLEAPPVFGTSLGQKRLYNYR